ncbi:glycosyltransferase [Petroclostridium sp. X23]|uniref:glycosyltransferase n=1 Tax=Petroclostridium sp. X23 TaxID=3045146 RepID=UPI0024AE3ECD|nr:glycosyltransferase [Petroclostridium sp. X23]WHH61526.1 glycosyltransferase [Petroclostridium sp. X23]
MMLDIFIQSLFCFFAVYGIIQMGVNIYNILHNFKLKKDDIYIIITVKNQQETIEGIIRSVVWKSLNNTQSGMVPNILVVDMGSTDETVNILNKLCTEYDFIQVTDSEGYSKILQNLMR